MLNIDALVDFPESTVKTINSIISKRRDELKRKNLFINDIVREDIFDILESCCTVVYYPLPGEENDGFHITIPVDYIKDASSEHFVYLNTDKYLEKQVFAAAHELGHIWIDEEQIWTPELQNVMERNHKNTEYIMNRFAAELLMPDILFTQSAREKLDHYKKDGNKILVVDVFRVVASLMDEFCATAQAVIVRFYETGIFSKSICRMLLSGPTDSQNAYSEFFDNLIGLCIQEGGYTRLHKNTDKRGINGFPELLDEAERKHLISSYKADSVREMLGIPIISNSSELIQSDGLIDIGDT